jgi:hypothetical protein
MNEIIKANKKKCIIDSCNGPHRARGYCVTHYNSLVSSGELVLVLPRRTDSKCIRCKGKDTMVKSSYCRKCATDMEKVRRDANKSSINEKRRERYSPEKNKKRRIVNVYNVTIEEYNTMVTKHANRCAICNCYSESLHVDHDHSCCPGTRSCGKCIRGLLCSNCNNGLGRFYDNITTLENAIKYLTSFRDIAATALLKVEPVIALL